MARTRLYALAIAALLLAALASTLTGYAEEPGIAVSLDRRCYDRGDVAAINISARGTVAIEVWSSDGTYLLWIDQVEVNGSRIIRVLIPPDAPETQYVVYAALNNSVPQQAATFLVRRPTFRIASVAPEALEGDPGASAELEVVVTNQGAEGAVEVRVANQHGEVVASATLVLGYGESKSVKLGFRLPGAAGSYTWTVALVNKKYGTVDDSRGIPVRVRAPPPPPAPPIVVTPTTTPTPTTPPPGVATATPVPVAPRRYVVQLRSFAPGGLASQRVVVALPQGGSIEVRPGTRLTIRGRPLANITIEVLEKPPVEIATQKPVGPIYRLGPEGAVFDPPLLVSLPFRPWEVPEGYRVMLAYFDEKLGLWRPLRTVYVNTLEGIVVGEVRHFSVISVVAFRVLTPVKEVTQVITVTLLRVRSVTETITLTSTRTLTRTQVLETPLATMTITRLYTRTRVLERTRTSTLYRVAIATATKTTVKERAVTTTVPYTLSSVVITEATKTVVNNLAIAMAGLTAFAVTIALGLSYLLARSRRQG